MIKNSLFIYVYTSFSFWIMPSKFENKFFLKCWGSVREKENERREKKERDDDDVDGNAKERGKWLKEEKVEDIEWMSCRDERNGKIMLMMVMKTIG